RRQSKGFDADTLATVLEAWRAQATEESIAKHSPASVAATFELLRAARGRSLAQALELEFQAASRALRRPDFLEGVRAALVDKAHRPRWSSAFARRPLSDLTV